MRHNLSRHIYTTGKKGNFPQKVEMINENICNFSYGRHKFVLFAKHTNKHIFFHSQYQTLPLMLDVYGCVCVCVRALCVRICGFSYLALLSFVVYSRISFNVMFFRFAVAQLFISDKYGLNKR